MTGQRAEGKGQREGQGKRATVVHGVALALALVVMLALTASVALAQQTIIFVRHGERADGGAGASTSMTGAPADPSLSAAGEARAAKLAAALADAKIRAIFVTEFRRTQETARPLAAKLGLTARVVPAGDTAALVARLKSTLASDVVLVIGHSNTIPGVIKALGGSAITIRDDEYDALYVFTPSSGALIVIRY